MGNHLALAAVTAALRNRLTAALEDDGDPSTSEADVSTKPVDEAFAAQNGSPVGNRLNIFLYHVMPNAAWRNRATPPQVKPGETGSPPLALTLHYLISAHGNGGDDIIAHRLLGAAIKVLHDQPLFTVGELAQLQQITELANSDLHLQVERVRITEQPLTTEEMYKLWSAFQTHYRVSTAYEVSVVLIDSARPIRAPLPALGVSVPSDPAAKPPLTLLPRLDLYPTLTAVAPPSGRDHVLLGDDLVLSGSHLRDDPAVTPTALLSHPLLPATVRQAVTIDQGTIKVTVPEQYTPPGGSAFRLPAGVYTLALEIASSGKPTVVTNALPFLLAPEITLPEDPITLDGQGIATIDVTVSPHVWPAQKVHLLVGAQGFAAAPLPTSVTGSLSFPAKVPEGEYYVRIRVDGVDSSLLDPVASPPAFDPDLKITIEAP